MINWSYKKEPWNSLRGGRISSYNLRGMLGRLYSKNVDVQTFFYYIEKIKPWKLIK